MDNTPKCIHIEWDDCAGIKPFFKKYHMFTQYLYGQGITLYYKHKITSSIIFISHY